MNIFDPLKVDIQGINLIEAGAGTGKTFNIASVYVRCIVEKGMHPRQILVLTFTRAATSELKRRLYSKVRNLIRALRFEESTGDAFLDEYKNQITDRERALAHLTKAIDAFDEAAIHTIHGFCQRVLEENGFRFGEATEFDVIETNDSYLSRILSDEWRKLGEEATSNSAANFLLQYLMNEGLYPSRLKTILQELISKPYSTVLPEAVGVGEFDDRIAELLGLRDLLRGQWNQGKEALLACYYEDGLKRNVYRTGFPGQVSSMEEWVKSDALFTSWKYVHLFRKSKIEASVKKDVIPPEESFCNLLDSYYEKLEEIEALKYAYIHQLNSHIRNSLAEQYERDAIIDYNELLIKVRRAVRDKNIQALLASKYPIALLDEFQDTDPIQYDIFSSIYGKQPNTALFMIGDPKQSIYGFRGADIFTYLKAREDAPDEKKFSLLTNHRSVPGLIDAANHFFGYRPNSFVIEQIEFNDALAGIETDNEDEACVFIPFQIEGKGGKAEVEEMSASITARQIAWQLYGSKEIKARDLAVLVRENRQALLVQDYLKQEGVKSIIKAKTSVFETREAAELILILTAILNNSYEPAVKAALTTRMIGFSASQILDVNAFTPEFSFFKTLQHSWEEYGIQSVVSTLVKRFGILSSLASYEDGERLITNFIHISELLQQEEQSGHLEPFALLNWLQSVCDDIKKKEEPLRLESDDDLVQITTIHNSKGLEYDSVFLPFMWQGIRSLRKGASIQFHNHNLETLIAIDGGNEEQRRAHLKEEIAENIRLTYVALTRARKKCFINWNSAHAYLSPLHVLLLDKNELDHEIDHFVSTGKSSSEVNAINDRVVAFITDSNGSITKSDTDFSTVSRSEVKASVTSKPFTKSINRTDLYEFERITSYSALTSEQHAESIELAKDEQEVTNSLVAALDAQLKDIFHFPKGKDAGNCLHTIFEEISFTNSLNLDEVIAEQLSAYGFQENWHSVLKKQVQVVLETGLLPDTSLRLADIKDGDCIKEMSFYLEAKQASAAKINDLVGISSHTASEESITGYLKGFIDLVIRNGGKYYILDYKSNYLGDQLEDYTPDKLEVAMSKANYHLQYHLYTVALHRYLSRRMPDYSYDQHFGGVFYLFVRGMDLGNTRTGIFFDNPDFETISKLDDYFASR